MAALTPGAFVSAQHPLYRAWQPIWTKLAHAYEGTGGFADGTYLVPHPREWQDHQAVAPTKPTKKLLERRALARYENWPRRIIKTFADSLFRQTPMRLVGGKSEGTSPLEQWWANVDGNGLAIDDYLAETWRACGVFGHAYVLFDRPPSAATTASDAPAPYLRTYMPTDATDWLHDDTGRLIEIKFIEAAPRENLKDVAAVPTVCTRYVTSEGWILYNAQGEVLSEGEHRLGVLPVVPVFADKRLLVMGVGASLLGDPQLFIDYYNLISENRELLRKQTFAILNIPIGPEGDVERAKGLLGDTVSTDNVLFSGLPAAWLSPSAENTQAYDRERAGLLRDIFRLAGIQWEADSRDAEALGSLKLKREDMNTALAGFADNLETADYAIARLWYRATEGADRGVDRFTRDQVEIRYPDTFEITPFETLLAEAQAAFTLDMGIAFKKALRKRLVQKFLPDLPPDELKTITTEIDAQTEDVPLPETVRAALVGRMTAAAAGTPSPTAGAA